MRCVKTKVINIFFIVMLMCVLGIAVLSTMQGIEFSEEGQVNEELLEQAQEPNKPVNDVEDTLPVEEGPAQDENLSDYYGDVSETVQFCGISTYNPCESDEDCIVTGCLNQVCQTKSEEELETECSPKDCYDSEKYGYRCGCFDSHCKWG